MEVNFEKIKTILVFDYDREEIVDTVIKVFILWAMFSWLLRVPYLTLYATPFLLGVVCSRTKWLAGALSFFYIMVLFRKPDWHLLLSLFSFGALKFLLLSGLLSAAGAEVRRRYMHAWWPESTTKAIRTCGQSSLLLSILLLTVIPHLIVALPKYSPITTILFFFGMAAVIYTYSYGLANHKIFGLAKKPRMYLGFIFFWLLAFMYERRTMMFGMGSHFMDFILLLNLPPLPIFIPLSVPHFLFFRGKE